MISKFNLVWFFNEFGHRRSRTKVRREGRMMTKSSNIRKRRPNWASNIIHHIDSFFSLEHGVGAMENNGAHGVNLYSFVTSI